MTTSVKPEGEFKPAIRSLLKRMGLEEKEIDVYLALLSMKMARVSVIANAAKQPRSHTYLLLEALEKRGLVSRTEKSKVLHFVAEHPRKLLSFVEDRQQEMNEIHTLVSGALPYLASLNQIPMRQPRVTVSQGLQAMKQIYREVFSHEFYAMLNAQSMYNSFDKNIFSLLFGNDLHMKGKQLLVFNEGAQRFERESQQTEDFEFRHMPMGFNFEADISVFDDMLTLFTYDDEWTVVQIENASLADGFRNWFNFVWAISTQPKK